MNILITILTFCIVLFLYLHIFFHLKTSNDLEIYEVDKLSKDKLEEICDIRQPIVFDYNNEAMLLNCNVANLLNNYEAFDLKIRNINDINSDNEIYVPLKFGSTVKLFEKDNEKIYYSENNSDFLEETGVIKHFKYNDSFLRPYMVTNCKYDMIIGTPDCTTPLRYDINYRNYFYVTSGSITIKLTQPQSERYLYPEKDYENFEFRSPINAWNIQHEYKADYDKIKFLEFTLNKGQILYIPAYWWYTIKFGENAFISSLKYRTYMNNVAILPEIIMSIFQQHNLKHETVKKMEMNKTLERSDEDNKEDSTEKVVENTNLQNIVPNTPPGLDNNIL